jgi:hypothetical protein
MFKEIPNSDINIRPLKVYKRWVLDEDTETVVVSYGVSSSFGAYEPGDGLEGVIYRSVKSQFYLNPTTASILTEVGRRKSYTSDDERVLGDEFALIAVPQSIYGEGIKIGSVKLVDNTTQYEYTDDRFSNLVSGSEIVGNIFYDRGFIVLTKNVQSGSLTDFRLELNSTQTIYENEIFISVLEGEFNTTQNPTAYINIEYDSGSIIVKPRKLKKLRKKGGFFSNNKQYFTNAYTQSFANITYGKLNPLFLEYQFSSSVDPTGSYLAPYITTIGLYDDGNQLVAVAKLAHPLKSYPDYPINFIIRFDT